MMPGPRIGGSRLKPGIAHLEHEAFGISIRSRALRELTSTRIPRGGTGIGGKVIRHVRRQALLWVHPG